MRSGLRRLAAILAVTAIIALVICAGAVWFLNKVFDWGDFGVGACDIAKPEIAEDIGQFKFPPSAKIISTYCFGMQGWLGSAQFEMSPSDLKSFLDSTKVKQPLLARPVPTDSLALEIASKAESYLYGQYETVYKSGKFFEQEILIDISDSKKYIVYVLFSGG